MTIQEYLVSIGFEQKLPWQFHNDHYQVTQLESDSLDIEMWSIISKRYDSCSFRGRLTGTEDFIDVFARVKEDYTLTDEEELRWKSISVQKKVS